VPLACQDWANTKAAYRFFSNERVDEGAILAGHFQATRERAQASSGPLLVLQDTTEFSYKRDKPELVGFTGETISRKDEAGRWRKVSGHPTTSCDPLSRLRPYVPMYGTWSALQNLCNPRRCWSCGVDLAGGFP
jgi:hypothetical protein